MFTQWEQEEYNRILANPLEFLKEEFQEGGAFYASACTEDDLESGQIILTLGKAGSLCVHLEVWVRYKGLPARASYLAFWHTPIGGANSWRISMIDVSEIYAPYAYEGSVEDLVIQDAEERLQKTVTRCEEEKRPTVAWCFPRGALGAESYPELTSFYANEKAKEAGVIVV